MNIYTLSISFLTYVNMNDSVPKRIDLIVFYDMFMMISPNFKHAVLFIISKLIFDSVIAKFRALCSPALLRCVSIRITCTGLRIDPFI